MTLRPSSRAVVCRRQEGARKCRAAQWFPVPARCRPGRTTLRRRAPGRDIPKGVGTAHQRHAGVGRGGGFVTRSSPSMTSYRGQGRDSSWSPRTSSAVHRWRVAGICIVCSARRGSRKANNALRNAFVGKLPTRPCCSTPYVRMRPPHLTPPPKRKYPTSGVPTRGSFPSRPRYSFLVTRIELEWQRRKNSRRRGADPCRNRHRPSP